MSARSEARCGDQDYAQTMWAATQQAEEFATKLRPDAEDRHDADEEDELPPVWPLMLGLALIIVAMCGFVGWALPILASKVIP